MLFLSVVVMYLCFVVKCLELVLIEYLIMQLKTDLYMSESVQEVCMRREIKQMDYILLTILLSPIGMVLKQQYYRTAKMRLSLLMEKLFM